MHQFLAIFILCVAFSAMLAATMDMLSSYNGHVVNGHVVNGHTQIYMQYFYSLDQRNSRGYIFHANLNAGIHLNVRRCTFRCILEKWLHFKRASHFHQNKKSLDVDEDPLLVYTSTDQI